MTETTVIDPFTDPRTFHLTVFGVPVRLIIGGRGRDEFAERVLYLWKRCDIREVTGVDVAAEFDGAVVRGVLDPDEAVHEAAWALDSVAAETVEIAESVLTPAVTMAAITWARGKKVMLHAGAIAHPETGRTAVLIGASGTGKTTATRTLATQFGYVTDETVAVAADGSIQSFAKPLALLPEDRAWGKRPHSPDEFNLLPAPAQLSLGALVLLTRDPDGPDVPEVRELSTIEALPLVGEHTSYFGELDQPLHELAALIRSVGSVRHVTYREAATLTDLVAELLATPPVPAPPLLPVSPPLAELDYDVEPFGRTIARRELRDFYVEDDGAAAMTLDGRVLALSALAGRIMTLIGDTPTTLAPVAAALTDEFGEPPGDMDHQAMRLADDVVADLVGSALLDHLD